MEKLRYYFGANPERTNKTTETLDQDGNSYPEYGTRTLTVEQPTR
jgi:hypothetical protein